MDIYCCAWIQNIKEWLIYIKIQIQDIEYENKETQEADFIKQVDKLECILQAGSYGLNSKYIRGAEAITIPCLKEILEDVYKITKNNELPLCVRKKD